MTLSDEVRAHLQSMIKYGPQFAINDDVESCVRLTDTGVNSFTRIYSGRPTPNRIEKDGVDCLYFFTCSQDQLFLYFRRFGPGEAEVISPNPLRQRMIEFHRGALAAYGQA